MLTQFPTILLLTSFYTVQPSISNKEDGRIEKDGGTLSPMARKNSGKLILIASKKSGNIKLEERH